MSMYTAAANILSVFYEHLNIVKIIQLILLKCSHKNYTSIFGNKSARNIVCDLCDIIFICASEVVFFLPVVCT